MFPKWTPNVPNLDLNVPKSATWVFPNMFPKCQKMFPKPTKRYKIQGIRPQKCSQFVPNLAFKMFPNVPKMLPKCSQNVPNVPKADTRMFPKHFKPKSNLETSWVSLGRLPPWISYNFATFARLQGWSGYNIFLKNETPWPSVQPCWGLQNTTRWQGCELKKV